MYTATIATNQITGTMDQVADWLLTQSYGWDTDTILSALRHVVTYQRPVTDLDTSIGRIIVTPTGDTA